MEVVPDALRGVFFAWAAGFGETVFPKFVTLLLGAVLATGRRTVSRVVFVVGELAEADQRPFTPTFRSGCNAACFASCGDWH